MVPTPPTPQLLLSTVHHVCNVKVALPSEVIKTLCLCPSIRLQLIARPEYLGFKSHLENFLAL